MSGTSPRHGHHHHDVTYQQHHARLARALGAEHLRDGMSTPYQHGRSPLLCDVASGTCMAYSLVLSSTHPPRALLHTGRQSARSTPRGSRSRQGTHRSTRQSQVPQRSHTSLQGRAAWCPAGSSGLWGTGPGLCESVGSRRPSCRSPRSRAWGSLNRRGSTRRAHHRRLVWLWHCLRGRRSLRARG